MFFSMDYGCCDIELTSYLAKCLLINDLKTVCQLGLYYKRAAEGFPCLRRPDDINKTLYTCINLMLTCVFYYTKNTYPAL